MNTPTKATVVFLRTTDGSICLAQKKKPIHHAAGEITHSLDTWNGYGGKKEETDETIEDTAIRELRDESGVDGISANLIPCGHVYFFWPKNKSTVADMEVWFYFLDIWEGMPEEGSEMGPPQFFTPSSIPYGNMMEGDKVILPMMLIGVNVKGSIFLGEKDDQGKILFVPSD